MIEYPFAYEKLAAGENILGRENEVAALVHSIRYKGKGAAIYDTPQSGKETIVRESLDSLRDAGFNFIVCELNLFNIRSYEEFLELLRTKMSECFREANRGAMIPFDIDISSLPAKKILELPQIIAKEACKTVIVYIKEFQNILLFERDSLPEDLDKIWSRQKDVRYILTGSMVNAMKSLFEERKLFASMTTIIELGPIDRSLIARYVISSFLSFGRVIETEEALEICAIASCKMSLVKQLCAICFSQPAGYINRKIVNQARDKIISRNEPYFRHIMTDLTSNQISFLKAIIDGVEKFSSAEIMETYKLNSSANVFRIKDALKKKEVIILGAEDAPMLQDPLFEYWLRYYYFT